MKGIIKGVAIAAGLLYLAASLAGCQPDQTLRLSGTVEYTQYDVVAETSGKITTLNSAEGEVLQAGASIATIDSALQETTTAQMQAQVVAREATLDELQAGSRRELIRQAEAAVKAAQAQYDGLRKGPTAEQVAEARAAVRIAAANKNTAAKSSQYADDQYDDAHTAYHDGRLTQAQLDAAKHGRDLADGQYQTALEQYRLAQAQFTAVKKGATADTLKAAQAALEQAQAQLELARTGSTPYALTVAQANLDAARAQLKQARLLQARCVIQAPVAGTLVILNIQPGDMVTSGGYVASVADTQDLWVHLYVPQARLKLFTLSQNVPLTTTAFAGATFTGTVVYLASEAEFTPQNIETNDAKENTVFKVKLRIADPSHQLRAGMTMAAAIPLP